MYMYILEQAIYTYIYMHMHGPHLVAALYTCTGGAEEKGGHALRKHWYRTWGEVG